ncbi:hypothetical protein EA462_13340 [Natrarchaeobius halalkaliphilus]|uniref:Uncharacterized protein n=1 Tax=Natrarchaeobius halalkaliphilus TaxID=1679091 RepID=A0A3N6MSV5_9EURY|nr:hypothetical protein EA462_13340 [Natrarchaeobius halalkaliphilus]
MFHVVEHGTRRRTTGLGAATTIRVYTASSRSLLPSRTSIRFSIGFRSPLSRCGMGYRLSLRPLQATARRTIPRIRADDVHPGFAVGGNENRSPSRVTRVLL